MPKKLTIRELRRTDDDPVLGAGAVWRWTVEAGAYSFVLKRAIATDLLDAVEHVRAVGRGEPS